MIKLMYSVFLGLILVTFVGVGVSVFYPMPEEPDYPVELEYAIEPTEEEMREDIEVQKAYDAERNDWNEQFDTYNRNVAIITLVAAVAFLYAAIEQAKRLEGLTEGVLLGGIFTLLYSLIRSMMAGDDVTTFLFLTAGLAVAVWVGRRKFAK